MKKTLEIICPYGIKYNISIDYPSVHTVSLSDIIGPLCCYTCSNYNNCKESKIEYTRRLGDIQQCNHLCKNWYEQQPCDKILN